MGFEQLSVIVALLAALSVAAERLVEIVKNIVPFLRDERTEANTKGRISKYFKWSVSTWEGIRKAGVQALAVLAGILTVWLAEPALKGILPGNAVLDSWLGIAALGFLASGGSAFWNKLVGYVGAVRDARNAVAVDQEVKAVTAAKDKELITDEVAKNKAQNLLGDRTVRA